MLLAPRPDFQPHRNIPPSRWDRRWLILLGGMLLAGCILAAYQNTFRVPFLLDDSDSIEKNKTIRSFATALAPPANSGLTVSGRPLLNLSLAINYRLGGTDVVGYHVGNLLIHFAAALCLFGVVRRTFKLPRLADKLGTDATLLAWFASALWVLHPLQTESVTYIIQRAESLVGLCYLFTLYSFIRAVEKPSRLWSVVTICACLLGMAAKEVMASAPLVIFLYDRTFVSGTFRESWRRHHRLHLALAASWLLLLALVITSGGRGATVGFTAVSWFDYLSMQGPGITTYLFHSVVPVDLVFDYGAVLERRMPVLLGGLAVVLALLAATIVLLKKRPAAGFIGAWFFLILAPSSSVIPVATQTLAEHRMYLPLAAVAVGITLLARRIFKTRYWVPLAVGLVLLSVGTSHRNGVYQTSLSIWEDTARKVSDNVRALNNLGLYYLEANRYEDAIKVLSEAYELAPNFSLAYCNLGRAQISKAVKDAGLGASFEASFVEIEFESMRADFEKLLSTEQVERGLALFERAIGVNPGKAVYPAYLGNALLLLGKLEAAAQAFEQAASLDAEDQNIQYALANTLSRLDRNEAAAEHFIIALRLKPDDAEALTNYGSLLRRMSRFPESISNLQAALRLRPDSARIHSNLGVSLLQSGRTAEGILQLQEALRLDPNLPQARYNLFNVMAETDYPAEAIIQLEALLKIAPATAELVSNLGVLYARVGRLDEAAIQMRRALQIDPNYEAAQENLAKITAYLQSHPAK